MKINEVKLRGFRNISEIFFTPDSHLNFIIGKNGQGKTSILEAISFLSTLRSFRGAKNDEVLQYQNPWSEIGCRLEDEGWATEIKVTFTKQENERVLKTAFVDGKAYKSSSHFLSTRYGQKEVGFHSIIFNPSDHDLVRGEPALRRQYLDRVISAEGGDYLKTLSRYQKVVEQRNTVLKQNFSVARTPEWSKGFDDQLVELGAQIGLQRLQWVQRLQERLNNTARKISPTQPDLSAFYVSSWMPEIKGISLGNRAFDSSAIDGHFSGQSELPSLDFLKTSFWNKLQSLAEAEARAGVTLAGPHRDDWTLVFAGQPLKGHGSQGEVRSALIALKLSEIDLFRTKTGYRPVLLLDDFSSELDRERRAFLLQYLSETDLQVFVTSTEEPPFEGKIFRMHEGQIS
jgi:DNA replication and repair protein RecF